MWRARAMVGPQPALLVVLVVAAMLFSGAMATSVEEAEQNSQNTDGQCRPGDTEACLVLHKKINSQHNENLQGPKGGSVYIFGYGSLINKASRIKSGAWDNENEEELWVDVRGLKRSWSYCAPKPFEFVALGCDNTGQNDDVVSGVLFKVNPAKLPDVDKREAEYVKLSLDYSRISLTDNSKPLPERFKRAWMFVYMNPPTDRKVQSTQTSAKVRRRRRRGRAGRDPVAKALQACPNKPIAQSYLDLVLSGFVVGSGLSQQGAEAAIQRFVTTTSGWPVSCGSWATRPSGSADPEARLGQFIDERRWPRAMGPLSSVLAPGCHRCVDHNLLEKELSKVSWFSKLPAKQLFSKADPSLTQRETNSDVVAKLFAWIDRQLTAAGLFGPTHSKCRQEASKSDYVLVDRPPWLETQTQVTQDADRAVKHK